MRESGGNLRSQFVWLKESKPKADKFSGRFSKQGNK